MWPFRKKVSKSEQKVTDCREWNEDWQIGDVAECVCDDWVELLPPWHRPKIGQRLTVSGFSEGLGLGRCAKYYFLHFSDWPVTLSTGAFRKVRPVAEHAGTAEKILNAVPGPQEPVLVRPDE